MTFLKKATTTVAALAISVGLSASVIAQDDPIESTGTGTGDVQIEVFEQTEATVSVEITDLEFAPIEYSFVNQVAEGEIIVTASDTRGNANGWNVTLTGVDFEANTFTIDNLSLVNPQVATTSGTGHITEAQPTASSAAPVVPAPGSGILTAPPRTGAGTYEVTYDANLTVPAGTLVGEYESTLTVTITGDDPGTPGDPDEDGGE